MKGKPETSEVRQRILQTADRLIYQGAVRHRSNHSRGGSRQDELVQTFGVEGRLGSCGSKVPRRRRAAVLPDGDDAARQKDEEPASRFLCRLEGLFRVAGVSGLPLPKR